MAKTERTIEAEGRIENINELSTVAMELAARDPDADLDAFLEQVSRMYSSSGSGWVY